MFCFASQILKINGIKWLCETFKNNKNDIIVCFLDDNSKKCSYIQKILRVHCCDIVMIL